MTFTQARWRLQLLAELGVGVRVRESERAEEAQYTRLKESTLGTR